MFYTTPLFPLLVFVMWLAPIVYGLLLATRLVHAVERIAAALTERPPDSPRA